MYATDTHFHNPTPTLVHVHPDSLALSNITTELAVDSWNIFMLCDFLLHCPYNAILLLLLPVLLNWPNFCINNNAYMPSSKLLKFKIPIISMQFCGHRNCLWPWKGLESAILIQSDVWGQNSLYLDDLTTTRLSVPSVCIILYADDVLLIAPTVCVLDALVKTCDLELDKLDTVVNTWKLCCLCIGTWNNALCLSVSLTFGTTISQVNEMRYLGIFTVCLDIFKCSLEVILLCSQCSFCQDWLCSPSKKINTCSL